MAIWIDPFRQSAPGTAFISTLTTLTLTTGLSLCLDAGDTNSYASGQKWLDTSGNGYDFFLGTTSAAQGTDPTFNGSAGALTSNEYFSFDGGDYFTYDTTNETWMQNLHKNNAIFSFAGWVYLTGDSTLFGTSNTLSGSAKQGMLIDVSGNDLTCVVFNATAATWLSNPAFTELSYNTWAFVGGSYTESTGAGTLQVFGTQRTISNTYTSPTASNMGGNATIFSSGSLDGASISPPSGSRIAMWAMWGGTAIGATALNNIYNSTKTRFGL